MRESDLRSRVVRMLRPLHAFAVENVVHDGCPDVCCVSGWIELKLGEHPARATTPVNFGLRSSQRAWLRRWRMHGGNAWTLCVADDVWYLHDGHWASERLDLAPRAELTDAAIAAWRGVPSGDALVDQVTRRLPLIRLTSTMEEA